MTNEQPPKPESQDFPPPPPPRPDPALTDYLERSGPPPGQIATRDD